MVRQKRRHKAGWLDKGGQGFGGWDGQALLYLGNPGAGAGVVTGRRGGRRCLLLAACQKALPVPVPARLLFPPLLPLANARWRCPHSFPLPPAVQPTNFLQDLDRLRGLCGWCTTPCLRVCVCGVHCRFVGAAFLQHATNT